MKIVCSGLFLFLVIQFSAAQDVDFYSGSWAEVNALAKQQNKLIMVDAYTDWCGPCKQMDNLMFHNNTDVASVINTYFIAYKVDCERDFGLEFSRKFKVAGYPSLLFFNADGQLIDRQLGFNPSTPAFVESITAVIKMDPSDTYGYDATKLDMPWPAFYANAYRNANDSTWKFPKDADINGFLSMQQDITSEISWAVMSRFPLDAEYTQVFKDKYDAYYELYKKEATVKMQRILFAEVAEAAKTNDREKFTSVIEQIENYFPGDPEYYAIQMQQYYFEKTENWEAYADLMNTMIATPALQIGIDDINAAAWSLYENCTDLTILQIAANWFNPYLEKLQAYAVMDTYAALQYKLNNFDTAEIWALKAIEAGRQSGENVKDTELLLEKIQLEGK